MSDDIKRSIYAYKCSVRRAHDHALRDTVSTPTPANLDQKYSNVLAAYNAGTSTADVDAVSDAKLHFVYKAARETVANGLLDSGDPLGIPEGKEPADKRFNTLPVSTFSDYLLSILEPFASVTDKKRPVKRWRSTNPGFTTSDEFIDVIRCKDRNIVPSLLGWLFRIGVDPSLFIVEVDFESGMGGLRKRKLLVMPKFMAIPVLAARVPQLAAGFMGEVWKDIGGLRAQNIEDLNQTLRASAKKYVPELILEAMGGIGIDTPIDTSIDVDIRTELTMLLSEVQSLQTVVRDRELEASMLHHLGNPVMAASIQEGFPAELIAEVKAMSPAELLTYTKQLYDDLKRAKWDRDAVVYQMAHMVEYGSWDSGASACPV
jgi:hypothetical protein